MSMAMEMEEIEAILEKIWDLHDKLSDAIHSVSRAHFLKTLRSSPEKKHPKSAFDDDDAAAAAPNGFVYVKDFDDSAVQEAKSLNAIRTALENLEDQLDFFQTIQTQQRAERDAAIARLEQSRICLAMRLADHQGKKYKVIDEALAFVGDVNHAGCFASTEILCGSLHNLLRAKHASQDSKHTNFLIKAVTSTICFAKNSLKLDHMGGILGNAALVAISMLAMLHVNHLAYKDNFALEPPRRQAKGPLGTTLKSTDVGGSSNNHGSQLNVLLARG
uniref:Plastid division protein PDV1 n=1 Tax=Kalanchoe fedtschenkoi TaxID=63787 RepID=A0A7N0T367_KALFE